MVSMPPFITPLRPQMGFSYGSYLLGSDQVYMNPKRTSLNSEPQTLIHPETPIPKTCSLINPQALTLNMAQNPKP